jgi:hypothetical protein
MPRVTYEAAHEEVETIDCEYADHDEDGVFVVCLGEPHDGGRNKTRIPITRVIRINEQIETN